MNNLDYGVIGNCRTAALISKEGSIDWLCFPDFDSPSIFAKILDKNIGGEFSFKVSNSYIITQKYQPYTNILSTSFKSKVGGFEVLDFMPRYRTSLDNYYAPSEIYRYIRLLYGCPSFKIIYSPAMCYGREFAEHKKTSEFIKSFIKNEDRETIYLYSSLDFGAILNQEEITLENNEFFLLSYNQKLVPIDIDRVYLEYQRTKVYWLNWSKRSKNHKHKFYNEMMHRSLLVLKLMTYHSTGAVLAALTTSLPETIGEERNWDYRFCWLRDASMSIETLLYMGHTEAAKKFIFFVKSILQSKCDSFQIMYGIKGERILTEEILPHLSGYENSYPVRIGNAAYSQRQNDVLGYLMDVIYKYYLYFPGTLDELEDIWEIVKNISRTVYCEWHNPDTSIWEFRNRKDHYVFSKIMSWVALDRAIKIAEILHKKDYAELWVEEAEKIKEEVFIHGWNEKIQSFSQTYNGSEVDSSLLIMEAYGFISADDDKFIKTVKTIQKGLFHKGLMFRYKIKDDFGVPSSAFTISTFWLIHALYAIGEKDEARKIFDNIISYSNHLGLFSEDLDFETKRQLGNFPQAYSHLALIDTAILFTEEKDLSKFIHP